MASGNVVPATVVGLDGDGLLQAPGQEQMGGLGGKGVMVYQKTSQFCRCCCLQPNIDWTIHPYKEDWSHQDNLSVMMNIKEDSPYVGRCCSYCYPGFRSTEYSVRSGDSVHGPVLFTHSKPWTCPSCFLVLQGDGGPLRCPCCCCLPYLETKDANGQLLGKTRYVCDQWIFVPKYDVEDDRGKVRYRLRPDVCVGGCCVRCRCGGGTKGKCFRIPFLIRHPKEPYVQVDDAAITDMWAGGLHECCTNREMYQLKFPEDADEKMRKTLIGSTLLVDITCNEQDQ